MYPFIRMAKEVFKFRNAPAIGVGDLHESHHRCWPQDLDFWLELNNGRTLTLYDLGRIPAVRRLGLLRAVKQRGWGLTVAGNTQRYRRRIRLFDRVQMRTGILGWDNRFIYIEQSMWRADKECANHALYRMAVASKQGIVEPARAMAAMGVTGPSPELPGWVQAWIESDTQRPWPPMQ